MLDDFALESSENLNSIFFRINSFAQSFFVRFQQIIYHFEGILMENVKIEKIMILNKLLITDLFATAPFLITKRLSFILVHRDLTNFRYS